MKNTLRFISGWCMLFLLACQNNGSHQAHAEKACADLDALFGRMDRLNSELRKDAPEAAKLNALMDTVEAQLKDNLASAKAECSFINQQVKPTAVRFEFVEPLAQNVIAGKMEGGLERVFRLGMIFEKDKEISEFFGEVMARIASGVPGQYLAFWKNNPDWQQKLVKSTRWATTDKEKLAGNLSALEGGKALADLILSN